MEKFLFGIIGGLLPAAVIILFHFVTLSGRLARIETNIAWIMNILKKCQLPSSNHIV